MTLLCRDCVKTQNKFWRKKIDLLKRAVFNFFDAGNGLPTHDFPENFSKFWFLHSLCRVLAFHCFTPKRLNWVTVSLFVYLLPECPSPFFVAQKNLPNAQTFLVEQIPLL